MGGFVDILLIIDWEINYIVGMSFYFVFNVFILRYEYKILKWIINFNNLLYDF